MHHIMGALSTEHPSLSDEEKRERECRKTRGNGVEEDEEEGGLDVSSNQGSQQGGQGGLVGSAQSTTKQPSSSLAGSLRGASQAYLSSRLLNRLTSGSHPTHTLTHSPPL